ncbi:hypothetical protein [Hydrogenovibrio kuenenii]|jgi:hypothetical protein|uniref:hypothetical protein n=1 Tax=Hydrogenovibrio kuenenii TaxID=63658 RepID=UPI00046734B0|nr:hypothetical protein [Hydrogenovibrio kuenenii]
MKWFIGVFGSLALIFESGCSLAPTTYRVPDYYETKTVPYHYKVGEVYKIKDLRRSYLLPKEKLYRESKANETKHKQDALQRQARLKANNGWVTHRKYKKQYLFE